MKIFKDFDVTEISKDTKAIVFKVPYSDYMEHPDAITAIENHMKAIFENLKEVGINALFIDNSIEVIPLTDELINSGGLKTL